MLSRRFGRASRGFTLVEMMVALALGLILTAAVTGLVVASMNNTNTVVKGMRVTEESRALNEIMTRELRRVRYDANALDKLGSGATGTVFNAITPSTVNVASDCIKFSYDANGDPTNNAGEFRMFSRTVVNGRGVIRYGKFNSAGAVDCTQGVVLSSPDIDVTCLRFLNVTASAGTTITSSDAASCFTPLAASPGVTLLTVPAGSLYFSMNLSQRTNGTTIANRRTDAMTMIRSPVIGP